MASIQLGSFGELDIVSGNVQLMVTDASGKQQIASISVAEILELIAEKSSNAAVKEALELAKAALISMTA